VLLYFVPISLQVYFSEKISMQYLSRVRNGWKIEASQFFSTVESYQNYLCSVGCHGSKSGKPNIVNAQKQGESNITVADTGGKT
jgi:hypothetical protein